MWRPQHATTTTGRAPARVGQPQPRQPRSTDMKQLLLLAIAPALAALVVAGCGGGSSSSSTQQTSTQTKAAAPSGAAATVSLRKLNVGNALVDSQGRTLYLFEADKGPMSTCNGACASLWP